MLAPWAGMPLPGGRPVPSGKTVMFHAAMSAGVSGRPRFGVCAKAAVEIRASAIPATQAPSLRVHMLHLSIAIDRPTRNGVVVLVRKCRDCGNSRGLATDSDKIGTSRLGITGFVPCAALQ